MAKDPARTSSPRKAGPQGAFGPGPWPTADCLRLALLARLQDAENVDLVEFFRQVYPQVLAVSHDVTGAEAAPEASSGTEQEVKNV